MKNRCICEHYETDTNSCGGECRPQPQFYVVKDDEHIGLYQVDANKKSTALVVYPIADFDAEGIKISVINMYGMDKYGEDFDENSKEMAFLYDNATLITSEKFHELIN